MSISLRMEHMLTKTRPVLPAGQVRPQAKEANEKPSHYRCGAAAKFYKRWTRILTGRRLDLSI
jgi:hypothetical protein